MKKTTKKKPNRARLRLATEIGTGWIEDADSKGGAFHHPGAREPVQYWTFHGSPRTRSAAIRKARLIERARRAAIIADAVLFVAGTQLYHQQRSAKTKARRR